MTRRRLAVSTFVVLLSSILSVRQIPVAARGAETFHLSKVFSEVNPCTGKQTTGTLDGFFVVQSVVIRNTQLHAVIHASAHGLTTDTDSNEYRVSFEGTGQFDFSLDDLPDSVEVPVRAEAISKGSGPNFTADGVVTIFTDGSPVELVWTPFCG